MDVLDVGDGHAGPCPEGPSGPGPGRDDRRQHHTPPDRPDVAVAHDGVAGEEQPVMDVLDVGDGHAGPCPETG